MTKCHTQCILELQEYSIENQMIRGRINWQHINSKVYWKYKHEAFDGTKPRVTVTSWVCFLPKLLFILLLHADRILFPVSKFGQQKRCLDWSKCSVPLPLCRRLSVAWSERRALYNCSRNSSDTNCCQCSWVSHNSRRINSRLCFAAVAKLWNNKSGILLSYLNTCIGTVQMHCCWTVSIQCISDWTRL